MGVKLRDKSFTYGCGREIRRMISEEPSNVGRTLALSTALLSGRPWFVEAAQVVLDHDLLVPFLLRDVVGLDTMVQLCADRFVLPNKFAATSGCEKFTESQVR